MTLVKARNVFTLCVFGVSFRCVFCSVYECVYINTGGQMVDGWNWCCSTAQTGLGNRGGKTHLSKDIFDMQLTSNLVRQL